MKYEAKVQDNSILGVGNFGKELHGTTSNGGRPNPEVSEKKSRRRFTAQYKLRILDELDVCSTQGEIGAILRREGLYLSNVRRWREQLDKGILTSLSPKKRGRKAREKNPLAKQVANLEKKNEKLTRKLKQAEAIIEIQKKISEIFGVASKNNGETN